MAVTSRQVALPEFVAPMLARQAEPFDDDNWLFEIKWDGFRSICRRDASGCRLLGRRGTDFTSRFADLSRALQAIPPGTILDGEIVALIDGKPDFTALLSSRRARRGVRIAYISFDLLYHRYQPMMQRVCRDRRAELRALLDSAAIPQLIYSDGAIGTGRDYYRNAVAAGLEGVVAKKLDSIYRPGVRVDDWLKIKPRSTMPCVVVGFEPDESYGLRCLIIAATFDGELKCVGRVGSGIDTAMRRRLLAELWSRPRPTPVVPCKMKGTWVEPTLFCKVSYAEVLASGSLRAPVFEGLIASPGV